MNFDRYYLLFVSLLKIIVPVASNPIANGNACDPAKQDDSTAPTNEKCGTDYPCHKILKKCLKKENGAGQPCGSTANAVCIHADHICQNNVCKIGQGRSGCTTGNAAKCVADTDCTDTNCVCSNALNARGFICSAAKIKQGEVGCETNGDCIGTAGNVKCDSTTRMCMTSGAKGLSPSYMLIALCFLLTRMLQ